MTNNDIVQKLWNLCDVLRDDGINYSDYVTELVLLLFIKMVHENTLTCIEIGLRQSTRTAPTQGCDQQKGHQKPNGNKRTENSFGLKHQTTPCH